MPPSLSVAVHCRERWRRPLGEDVDVVEVLGGDQRQLQRPGRHDRRTKIPKVPFEIDRSTREREGWEEERSRAGSLNLGGIWREGSNFGERQYHLYVYFDLKQGGT